MNVKTPPCALHSQAKILEDGALMAPTSRWRRRQVPLRRRRRAALAPARTGCGCAVASVSAEAANDESAALERGIDAPLRRRPTQSHPSASSWDQPAPSTFMAAQHLCLLPGVYAMSGLVFGECYEGLHASYANYSDTVKRFAEPTSDRLLASCSMTCLPCRPSEKRARWQQT